MAEKRKVNPQSSQSLTVSVSSDSFRKSSNTKLWPPPPPESKFSEPSRTDSDSKKRQRMDSGTKIDCRKKSQCWVLLMRLLIHPDGASLKKPFNPQVLGLETIQTKLSKGSYLRTREFADDIRAIFYHAMDSNPPRHEVHKNARELSRIFESNWKVLEEKWAAESGEGKKNSEVPVFSQEKKSQKTKKGGLQDSQQLDDTSMTDAANGFVKKRKHEGSRDSQDFDPQSRQKKQKSYSRLSESNADSTDRSASTPSGDYLRLKFLVQADSTNSSSQRVFTMVNISESKLEAKEASSIVAGRPKYQFRDPSLTAQKNLINFSEASKRKHEENEARIRAAKIKKEREANRLRLEEMERSVDIEDNLQIFRELDRLCGHTLYYNMKRLGLKLKAEWDY